MKVTLDTLTLGVFESGSRKETMAVPVPPAKFAALAPGSIQEALECGNLNSIADTLAALGRGLGPVYAAQDAASNLWHIRWRKPSELVEHWRKLRVVAEERYPADTPYKTPERTYGTDCDIKTVQSVYNLLTVLVRASGQVSLDTPGMSFSEFHPEHLATELAWDAMTIGALLGAEPPRSVLVLGLGCGTVTRQLRACLPETRLVGVEIDPEVLSIAREHFGLVEQNIEVVGGDALKCLSETDECFDVVINDLFDAGTEKTRSVEAPLDLIRRVVKPGGVLVTNCADTTVRGTRRAALAAAYAHVREVEPPRGENVIFAASNTPLRDSLPSWVKNQLSQPDMDLFLDVKIA